MTATDRLERYRAKRDFTITAEPSGSEAPLSDGRRFVVQRHRASHLHYDLRLEGGGVLISWAVPKGPTLDPNVKRMAMHVEDHPLGYYDFEGVIPKGEYGGGDVIVWDWGTWTQAKGDDAIQAVSDGELHFDLDGEKLSGRFALIRRGTGRQWLLVHKHDDHGVHGWNPEEYPRSVKSGRTNDEVKAAPAASWKRDVAWAAPTDDELAALDAIRVGGAWRLGEHTLKLTNLTKTLFPANGARPAITKRDVIRYYATAAPVMLAYLDGRPVNMHRFPDGITAKGFWHKAVPAHAPEFIQRWHYPDAAPGETQTYPVIDSPAALCWAANFGALELHPWTSTITDPHCPTWALIDLDPGRRTTPDELMLLAGLHRTALEHLGVTAIPKLTGQRGIQIWIPVAPGYTFDETRTWVERLSRTVGSAVPELVSWEWDVAKRNGLARLDYTQNAINKTLVAPFSLRPAPDAPVSVPITWNELDEPDLRSDRWKIDSAMQHIARSGDPLAPLIGMRQQLPPL